MPGIIFVTQVPVEWAIVLFSLAFFGQQSWSTLVMIVPTDLFDRRIVASVAGLVGFGGAMGGVVMNLLAGRLLDSGSATDRLLDRRQLPRDGVRHHSGNNPEHSVSRLPDPSICRTSMSRRLRDHVALSLDGFIAGPNGQYDWSVMDPASDFAALCKSSTSLQASFNNGWIDSRAVGLALARAAREASMFAERAQSLTQA